MKFFRHREIRQGRVVFRAIAASGPCLCHFDQITPVVCATSGAGKELIDALLCGLGVLGHAALPDPEVDGAAKSWSPLGLLL
jgi:hypothetical protein